MKNGGLLLAAALAGCGDATTLTDGGADSAVPTPDLAGADLAGADLALPPSTCVPGAGHDYAVGPGMGQLPSLADVPWESLTAGDTVRIHWQAAPYKGKFMVSGKGTEAQPIRICGVKGPNGERPVIDGKSATTRATLDYGNPIHQSRTLVLVKGAAAADWTYFPEWIVIEGLEITGQYPDYSFTDTAGAAHPYDAFGACVWVERGHHVTLRDNDVHDCTNGVFAKSTDDGDFAVTQDVLLEGNYLHDNGVVGDDHEHDSYVQSVGVTYQFNHYGPQRAGANGSALKDRSVGTVVRYNFVDGCARSLDLVEAEDYPMTATADPRYRTTFVYGNLIRKEVGGIPIHYGGDHGGASPGDMWGEPIFRKGTLYFFNNTVEISGDAYTMAFFQLSTTEEHAVIYNNVLHYTGTLTYKGLRASQEVGASWTSGGTIDLGVNWMDDGWLPNDPDHPVMGPVTGAGNVITGPSAPYDPATFVPLPASMIVDKGQPAPPETVAYPVAFEYGGAARVVHGSAIDLGGREAP